MSTALSNSPLAPAAPPAPDAPLAAADYDGTLFQHGVVSDEDLEAIAEWRQGGGRFGIVTGRDLGLLKCEIEAWSIPLDFMVCNNGAAIYDPDFSPVITQDLPPEATGAVLNHPAAKGSRYYVLAQRGVCYMVTLKPQNWLSNLNLPFQGITKEAALKLRGLQQICLDYDTQEEAVRHAETFNRDLGHILAAQENGTCLDIVAPGADKGAGLAQLLELKHWRPARVLVIGDGENDLPMIRRFGGFTVPNALEPIKKAARAIYPNVAAMLSASRS